MTKHKPLRKLSLDARTIRPLSGRALGTVAGGISAALCYPTECCPGGGGSFGPSLQCQETTTNP